MSDAVVYYCGGKKPLIELLVSIYTLRRFYDGEIVVCLGKTSVPYLNEFINSKIATIKIVPGSGKDHRLRQHWRSRWAGMGQINYTRVLHPDCDTVFVNKIDKLFDAIHKTPGWMTTFHSVVDGESVIGLNTRSDLNQWKIHVEDYRKVDPKFDVNITPYYIEFGLLGWRNRWPYCAAVANLCTLVKDDQRAMSYVLMKNGRKAHVATFKNPVMRRVRSYWRLTQEQFDAVIMWHSHPDYAIWWQAAEEAIKKNFMGLGNDTYLRSIMYEEQYKQWCDKTYANTIIPCEGLNWKKNRLEKRRKARQEKRTRARKQ
jgi:hypothetical protein